MDLVLKMMNFGIKNDEFCIEMMPNTNVLQWNSHLFSTEIQRKFNGNSSFFDGKPSFVGGKPSYFNLITTLSDGRPSLLDEKSPDFHGKSSDFNHMILPPTPRLIGSLNVCMKFIILNTNSIILHTKTIIFRTKFVSFNARFIKFNGNRYLNVIFPV